MGRKLRNEVRNYYKKNYPLNESAKNNNRLNPGNGWVSRIAHEPRVALNILYDFLQPYLSNGQIELLLEHKITRVEVNNDEIKQVYVQNLLTEEEVELEAQFFLDATELGDVLPLAGAEYSVGAEAKSETGATYHLPPKDAEEVLFDYTPLVDGVEIENTIQKAE